MNNGIKRLILVLATILLCNFTQIIFADDDHEEKDHGNHHHKKNHDSHHDDDKKNDKTSARLKIVDNQTYLELCGACHFAYQPELLPLASWSTLINTIPDHFDEDLELDSDSKIIIIKYLEDHSAENSKAKIAIKIVKSLKGQTPSRITEVPYIQKQHHEISAKVLSREAIGGSLSNCSACHSLAEQGIYEEDNVSIPK